MCSRYPHGLVNQGVAEAHRPALELLGRDDLDAYAAESHRRAAHAWEDGFFDRTVIAVPEAPEALTDETCSARTSAEKLAGLPASFRTDEPPTASQNWIGG